MAERIMTGGGRFDPDAPPIYFLASKGGYAPCFHGRHRYMLIACNELDSKADRERIEAFMDHDPSACVFLDSGIYWLTNRYARAENLTMDQVLTMAPEDVPGFDDLFTRYVEIVKGWESKLWGYVELDQGGAENKRRTRKRLHDEGLAPIPVYHPLIDGWDYFDELATSHRRICWGNIVQATRPERLRMLATMAERHRQYPDLWVHLLGITPGAPMLQYPTNSCDASAWLAGLIWVQGYQTFGGNRVFDLDGEEWRYRYGSQIGDDDHGIKGAELAIGEAAAGVRAWRAMVDRRAELLGEQRWPALLEDEPPAAPGFDPIPGRHHDPARAWRHTWEWRMLSLEQVAAEPICALCDATTNLTADHIVPVKLGGVWNDRSNLQTLCRSCNSAKGADDSEED